MLKTETPRNKPSRPPQIAKKSVYVYSAERFRVMTLWLRNEIDNNDSFVLKHKIKRIKTQPMNTFKVKAYPEYLSVLSFIEFIEAKKSNLARSISASYSIEVHAGKQLHFVRNDLAFASFKPSITSSPYNFFLAAW